MAAEDQVVLKKAPVPPLPMQNQKSAGTQILDDTQPPHLEAHPRLGIQTIPAGMAHPGIDRPVRHPGPRRLIDRRVHDTHIAVYPHARLVLRKQHMRVHLGIARHQPRIIQTAVELAYLPDPDPVSRLLPLADEAHEIEVRINDRRLLQLVIRADDAGIYHAFLHFPGSLNISPIMKSALSGSKGTKPPI